LQEAREIYGNSTKIEFEPAWDLKPVAQRQEQRQPTPEFSEP
jgi:hypothetical protein